MLKLIVIIFGIIFHLDCQETSTENETVGLLLPNLRLSALRAKALHNLHKNRLKLHGLLLAETPEEFLETTTEEILENVTEIVNNSNIENPDGNRNKRENNVQRNGDTDDKEYFKRRLKFLMETVNDNINNYLGDDKIIEKLYSSNPNFNDDLENKLRNILGSFPIGKSKNAQNHSEESIVGKRNEDFAEKSGEIDEIPLGFESSEEQKQIGIFNEQIQNSEELRPEVESELVRNEEGIPNKVFENPGEVEQKSLMRLPEEDESPTGRNQESSLNLPINSDELQTRNESNGTLNQEIVGKSKEIDLHNKPVFVGDDEEISNHGHQSSEELLLKQSVPSSEEFKDIPNKEIVATSEEIDQNNPKVFIDEEKNPKQRNQVLEKLHSNESFPPSVELKEFHDLHNEEIQAKFNEEENPKQRNQFSGELNSKESLSTSEELDGSKSILNKEIVAKSKEIDQHNRKVFVGDDVEENLNERNPFLDESDLKQSFPSSEESNESTVIHNEEIFAKFDESDQNNENGLIDERISNRRTQSLEQMGPKEAENSEEHHQKSFQSRTKPGLHTHHFSLTHGTIPHPHSFQSNDYNHHNEYQSFNSHHPVPHHHSPPSFHHHPHKTISSHVTINKHESFPPASHHFYPKTIDEHQLRRSFIIQAPKVYYNDLEDHRRFRRSQKVEFDRYKRSMPILKLIVDPDVKLDMPKTMENVGTVAKNSFEDRRAPMFHVRNMVGSAKNVILAAMRIPPQDIVIPTQYKILDRKEMKDNPEIVSRFSQIDSTDDDKFINTFKRLGLMLRESVKSGQETLQHMTDVAHSARKAVVTTGTSGPRILLPYVKATAVKKEKNPEKLMLIAPRIGEVTDEESSPDPTNDYVKVGDLMDAFGMSNPEKEKVGLTRFVMHPKKTTKIQSRFGIGSSNEKKKDYFITAEHLDEDDEETKDLKKRPFEKKTLKSLREEIAKRKSLRNKEENGSKSEKLKDFIEDLFPIKQDDDSNQIPDSYDDNIEEILKIDFEKIGKDGVDYNELYKKITKGENVEKISN